MPQDTILGNAILFLDKIGVYDVVLPFVLVFTIVFAILEKSMIFGKDKGSKGAEYSKKNINSLVAFTVAFFVIASSQIVEIITQVSAQMVILLLTSVFFLLLAGSFHKQGEFSLDSEGNSGYRTIFMVIMFVGILLIFLNAIKAPDGTSWLMFGLYWLQRNITSGFVSTVIVLLGIAGFMAWISGKPTDSSTKTGKKEGE